MSNKILFPAFLSIVFICCLAILNPIQAQNISINADGSAPDNSAMLDVSSTNGGLLIPRMTAAQRILIAAPADGLMVYQTNAPEGIYVYLTSLPAWTRISTSSNLNLGTVLTAGNDANADTIVNLNALNIGSPGMPSASLIVDSSMVVQGKPFGGFKWFGHNVSYDGVSAGPQYLNNGYADMVGFGLGRLQLAHFGSNTAGNNIAAANTRIDLEDSTIKLQGVATNFQIQLGGTVLADSVRIGNSYSFPASSGTLGQVLQYNGSGDLVWTTNTSQTLSSVLTAGKDAGADSIFNLNALTIGSTRAPQTSLEVDSFFVVMGEPFNGFRWAGFNAYYDGVSANPQYLNDGYVDVLAQGGGKLVLGHWGTSTADAILPNSALSSIELEDSSVSILGEASSFQVYIEGLVGLNEPNPNANLHVTSSSFPTSIMESSSTNGSWLSIGNSSIGGKYYQLISTGSANGEGVGKLLFGYGNTSNGVVGVAMTLVDNQVGIGTSNPTGILEVAGDGSLLGGLRVSGTTPATVGSSIYLDAATKDWTITATNTLSGAGNDKLVFRDYSSAADRMTIDNVGNVGIGTTNPGYLLDVNGSARVNNLRVNTANLQFGASMEVANRMNIIGTGSPNLFIGNSGSDYVQLIFNSAGYGQLFTTGTNDIILSPGGNVGIGLTNPSSALEVVGNVEIPAANNYTYSTAKTHYQSYAPTTFRSLSPEFYDFGTINAANFYTYFTNGGTAFGYSTVKVNLPDGARVGELQAWIYDNNATTPVRVTLYRQALGAANIAIMAEIESPTATATTAIQNLTDITIFNALIDNETYAYFLMFTGRQNNTETRLYGTKITYTVLEAD